MDGLDGFKIDGFRWIMDKIDTPISDHDGFNYVMLYLEHP
jgi:hypothetical protein